MTAFIQIGDTHFGTTVDFVFRKASPFAKTMQLVEAIKALPRQPDFVMHTGDVVEFADEDAGYQLAQTVLDTLDCPVYFATGNHDRAARLRRWMTFGEKEDLAADKLFYRFAVGDEEFLVLDGRGRDKIDPEGMMSAEQLDYLKTVPTTGNPLTVFLHFPVHPVGSEWIDSGMLLQNGAALHLALLPLRERLRGVFHGHLHQTMQIMRDGITYTCVASGFRQFRFWRAGEEDVADYGSAEGFNWVDCADGQTVVRRFSV